MLPAVEVKVFEAMQSVDVATLTNCSESEIRPVLPCLVRMSLIAPLDQSKECMDKRKAILCMLSGIEVVNSLVALLSVSFTQLETEVKREQQLKLKCGSSDSVLLPSGQDSAVSDFERSEALQKLRLVLAPIVWAMAQLQSGRSGADSNVVSELLDNSVHLEEVADIVCIALAELPHLLPPAEVSEALLRLRHGPALVARLVANMPDCIDSVCHALVAGSGCGVAGSSDQTDEDVQGGVGVVRATALRQLCAMCPSQVMTVRAICMDLCRMPSLAVSLTLDQLAVSSTQPSSAGDSSDVVAFISGILLGNKQSVRVWFQSLVRNGQKRKGLPAASAQAASVLQSLRSHLTERLQNTLLMSMSQQKLSDACVVDAGASVRLYCALRGIANIKFNEEELRLLVQLLTSQPLPTPAGIRFVSLSLCALIGCPAVLTVTQHEHLVTQWLHWLAKQEIFFEASGSYSSSFGEMLLLFAIHFHSNNLAAIMELVNNTLGMKMNTRHANLVRIKQIFTQEVFVDQVVTAHAVKVHVTSGLSADMPGTLPVHCIHQLLKSRAFTKHRVPINDWIFRQLCQSRTPLHPVLPSLIEHYVKSMLDTSLRLSADQVNSRIPENKIASVFDMSCFPGADTSCDDVAAPVTAQLLLLYYLLLYEDKRLSGLRLLTAQGRRPEPYRRQLISRLPVSYLLLEAQRRHRQYAGLFPPLLALLTQHYPQLCLVSQWMSEEQDSGPSAATRPSSRPSSDVSISGQVIVDRLQALPAGAAACARLLQQLLPLNGPRLWPLAEPLVSQASCLLRVGVPRQLQHQFRQLWTRLSRVFPHRLWTMTVNALRDPGDSRTSVPPRPLQEDDLVHDPLTVLRCRPAVFRSPALLQIVLHLLSVHLAASRSHLKRHLLEHPPPQQPPAQSSSSVPSDAELEELRTALLLAQDSASTQCLIEVCLETDSDRAAGGREVLQEIRSLICCHLHQAFIDNPMLAKLVHFQGYPLEALPVLVAGVPSMHICLDFIPELLSQPDLNRQTFAVDLTSHLALQYSIPRCYAVARLVVSALCTLLSVLPSRKRARAFLPMLPALHRLVTAFRPLADDVSALLLQLGQVAACQTALASGPAGKQQHLPPDDQLLLQQVNATFRRICQAVTLDGQVYGAPE